MLRTVLLLLFLCLLPPLFGRTPDWAVDAVWYQIFPERFRNGDPSNDPVSASLEGTWPYETPPGWRVSPWTSDWYAAQPWELANGKGFFHHAQLRRYGGDLQGILTKLDYLQKLGVNALYLNPIFESPSLHKYGATCFHHVDKHFGPDPAGDLKLFAAEDPADPVTWQWSAADRLFLKLIAEVHRRGMKIIIDGVFNHTGIPFWALQRAKREGPGSAYAEWFHIKHWDDPTTPTDEFEWQGWAGVKDLPELNRDEHTLYAPVRRHLQAIVQRWMDPNGDGDPSDGIDGWRFDVAAEVPIAFWEEVRTWVQKINPHAYLTGEIWWEDYPQVRFRNARPWLDRAFDGVMNYRFGDAAYQFFNQPEAISATRFGELLALQYQDYGYERCLQLQNLYDSHDTARLGSAVVNPQLRQDHGASVREHPEYLVRRPNTQEKRRWHQLVAFQFLAPGAPYIYYGDEVGMWGADDPDCRKPMVWSDLNYRPERAHPFGQRRSADPVAVDQTLWSFYHEWILRRRRLEVLRRGDFQIVLADDAARAFAFRRNLKGASVVAIFNASDSEIRLPMNRLGLKEQDGWRSARAAVRGVVVIPARWFKLLELGTH